MKITYSVLFIKIKRYQNRKISTAVVVELQAQSIRRTVSSPQHFSLCQAVTSSHLGSLRKKIDSWKDVFVIFRTNSKIFEGREGTSRVPHLVIFPFEAKNVLVIVERESSSKHKRKLANFELKYLYYGSVEFIFCFLRTFLCLFQHLTYMLVFHRNIYLMPLNKPFWPF